MTYTEDLRTIWHALRFSINYYDFIKMVTAFTMKKVVIFDYVHSFLIKTFPKHTKFNNTKNITTHPHN